MIIREGFLGIWLNLKMNGMAYGQILLRKLRQRLGDQIVFPGFCPIMAAYTYLML